jgi:hypothetical protein
LQRPLILIDYGQYEQNPMIFWTPRHLAHSWRYVFRLIITGKYRAKDKSELESQISKISKNKGSAHQKQVVEWFENSISSENIDKDVKIGPKGKLKHTDDIGDIDVFVIDHSQKILLSIECKRTEQARNGKEMIEEVDQYYHPKKGYFKKHIRRHLWLSSNINEVSKVYKLDLSEYKVFSFFATHSVLPIQFMKHKQLPIAVFSFFDLKNSTYDELLKKLEEFAIS